MGSSLGVMAKMLDFEILVSSKYRQAITFTFSLIPWGGYEQGYFTGPVS